MDTEMVKMKAYAVSDRNCDGCTYIVFAESRGKAISYALNYCDDAFGDYTFTELWARRRPKLDQYYNGRKELEWFDMDDRVIMVRDAGFYCSYEIDVTIEECEKCPAHKWCDRYESMMNGSWRYY